MTTDEMYIKCGKTKLQIPVLPEEIKISFNSGNSSVSVIDFGDIIIKQGRKAAQYSFSSIFPIYPFSGSTKKVSSPKTYVSKILKFIDDKSIVKLVLARANNKFLGISVNVVIDKFDYSENGEDPGTIEYSIAFEEYRSVTINQIKTSNKKATKSSNRKRTLTKSTAKTYKIKSGDCLYSIAKKELGNSNRWRDIYNLNKTVIENTAKQHGYKSSSTGHWIFPGTILELPK